MRYLRAPAPTIRVLIVYAPGQGVLQLLADSIAEGARLDEAP